MNSSPTSQRLNGKPAWLADDDSHVRPVFGSRLTATERGILERWNLCHTIARKAYNEGFDIDPVRVNRKFPEWKLWHGGGMAEKELVKLTGVKRWRQNTSIQKGE
jgi:hypothetical protein